MANWGLTRKQIVMLAVLVFGTFVTVLNQTVVSPALPSIMSEMSVDAATAQWLTTGFTLVNAIMVPITAFLTDRFTTRRLFLVSMILFTCGTALAAWGPSFPVLLGGRLVQAAGAGILMPLVMTVLMWTFPVDRRGTAMGVFGIVIAFAPFITGEQFYVPSFFLVLAVVAIFEVLLIMYFGVLGMKGYVPIGIAFGFSGAFIRLGIAAGNTLALIYEANPSFALVATTPTAIIFVCILSAIIIPLVRQEYNITKLMVPPATESLQEQRIKELAKEFSLSARETEIVMLIARGFTTDNVAKKLVISPYTVNTHIRHVYEKIGIHKRSELIDYINGNGSGESGN